MINGLISKIMSVIDSFPELTALNNEIDKLMKQENNRLIDLQTAFGSNFSEFAKSTGPEIKNPLVELQPSLNNQVSLHLKLMMSTSSFPNDIKQISNLHTKIEKSRAELLDSQNKVRAKEDEIHKLTEILNREQKNKTLLQRSDVQLKLDDYANKLRELTEQNHRIEVEVQSLEYEYRQTIMQIIITAYETFSTANFRTYSDYPKLAEQIKQISQTIAAQTDPSCSELQKQLNILENEAENFKNEKDPIPKH